jgi:hypothetical protein
VHPPDSQKVQAITDVSGDEIEPAIAVVAPRNRDLRDSKAPLSSEVEHFNVEHVPIDSLSSEEIEGDCALEELEAALRVVDVVEAHQRMHDDCEPF